MYGYVAKKPQRTAEDFWKRVSAENEDGCMLWTGPPEASGYGQLRCLGRSWRTHRLAYYLTYGEIPKGKQINHKCGNRLCCNPRHLYAGSAKENSQDAVRHGTVNNQWMNRTHCSRGHEYSEANTYIDPKRGWRQCRTCIKIRSQERRNIYETRQG